MWDWIRRILTSIYKETILEKFKLSDAMATSIFDISQVNMEELIRDVGDKEVMGLLKQVMKNNMIILKLQKQLLKLQEA